jgi:hypothetical protein
VFLLGYTSERSREWLVPYFKPRRCDYEKVHPAFSIYGVTEDIVSLARIAKLIEDNGGKIVDLDNGKLTHLVLDKRDDTRRRELMKRTSKYVHMHFRFLAVLKRICRPKHRNLVLSDFIEACIEENTLLNEAGILCLFL